ncbi:hypothetical protein C3B58_14725 [Lactonifactor longoviformis]|uniref:ABC transporter substrate-binding protein n=1 Tax=Lactonifactor longoviformis TaxID=341220 RepID=UPI000CD9FAB7|nr:extracellular solute-binding protein [Lactonifactor longoviformis]POP31823.1 hypothetical protein C3B58_14725 [Lactonifactor longoviformis]
MKNRTNKILYIISIAFLVLGAVGLIISMEMRESVQPQGTVDEEKIRFALYGNEEIQKIAEEVAETFMKQNKCKVEVYCYASEEELNSKIISQIAGGTTFDVFYTNQDILSRLMEVNELQELDDIVESRRQEGDEFYAVALENGNFDGKQYALPAGVMPYMIYYNRSFLTENGLEDVQTLFEKKQWNLEGFAAYMRAVKERTGKPGIALPGDWTVAEPFVRCDGGKYKAADGQVELNDKALETLEVLGQLMEEGTVMNAETEDSTSLAEAFSAGELPMIIGGLEMTRVCSRIDFEWDIVPYPSVESDFQNSNFDVPLVAAGNGKHVRMAKKFLSYYVSTLGQKIRLEKGECLIPSLSMVFYTSMGDVEFPEHSNYYFFAIENGYSSNRTGILDNEKEQILDIWGDYMEDGT